jgi:hypothetical protein
MSAQRASALLFSWSLWLLGVGALCLTATPFTWVGVASSALAAFTAVGFFAWLVGALGE